MINTKKYFHEFLPSAFSNGNYATDDVIAFLSPLFEEVLGLHEAGLVAPFEYDEALFVRDQYLDIDETLAKKPTKEIDQVDFLFSRIQSQQFDIVGNQRMETDVESGHSSVEELNVQFDRNKQLLYPAYVKGYTNFEILLGHHDAQTDILSLGLLLGSMALGLDLYDEEDLKTFASYRNNPVQFNHRIHPTISTLITDMTELDRRKRLSDLYEIIQRLQHYREYDPEKQTDLSKLPGWVNKALTERRQLILNKLRNRLFDTSRRNRLLYYKPNMRFVNLTVSSVPMVLHYQSIKADLLFTWNSDISGKVKSRKDIVLNKYLRFEDHTYLPSSLDKIRLESQRDKNEFGFSQLKLVIAFLNWHNLKENSSERIQSPLLLIPVELKKIKRLKEDHYSLQVLDNEAEVNPVLANQLKELYGIKLPDFIDLDDMDLPAFYTTLKKQIDAANQGIQLVYSDKPKIKLVHSIAKQTVGNYKRRLRRNVGNMEHYKNISYSYDPANYKPLGLEIFKQRIERRPSFLEFLVNEDIQLNTKQLTGENVKERELYQMVESENNPYSWDFDVCNMVLGNFNYKKMSLVRDYNQVIDNNVQHKVFDELFSDQPKQLKEFDVNLNDASQWHHVITADPTQTKAVLQSRTGESYIIQGPPGTGKSQTITNLIADFVARGKSILFVCEKRAALDVVFHRLKQNNLDELCCYIHDSQGDKRAFIKNLKTTYEYFTLNKMDAATIDIKRDSLLQQIKAQVQLLDNFHRTNLSLPENAGLPVRKLIDRIIELKHELVSLTPKQEEIIPHYNSWLSFGEKIESLSAALEDAGAEPAFADHPLSKLNDHVLLSEQPLNLLDNLLQQSRQLLKEILSAIENTGIASEHSKYLQQLKNLVQDAVLLSPLAEHDNLQLVDTGNMAAKELDKKIKTYKTLQKKAGQQAKLNEHWVNKMSEQDLTAAIAIAAKNEGSFFSFLNGSWRRLKKQLQESYNFSNHQVKPTYVQVLEQLQHEYNSANELAQHKNELEQFYQVDNIDITYMSIETLRNKQGDQEIDYLLAHPSANELVRSLQKLQAKLQQLEAALRQCFHEHEHKEIAVINDELETIAMNTDVLKELLPSLREFAQLPSALKDAMRLIALTPAKAEAGMAGKTLKMLFQQQKDFAATDILSIEKAVAHIRSCYKQLLRCNADLIRANIRQRFLRHVEISNTAISQLLPDQKLFKKNYNEGRKILENEFGKSMRYKSIRELAAKESGQVLKDIKPVWLMSPLSVSDSLPLDTSFFDVVIFDEASQITLEEGIPALFRSAQTIIVGDDKQMPPSNFFTARVEDPDDLEGLITEENEELLSADADSLLVQGARKLNSTMLSWHYRSRYETLISYSNHAFYEAGLLTIPDKTIHQKEKLKIAVKEAADAESFADSLYDRSISFHHLTGSLYEKRSNRDEAAYIARLVCTLLKRNVPESIGIVAFSQEQQNTIEDALTDLAASDKEFEQLLEAAYSRTEEDQFVGLIIKNLENIQGDERDIIIMSVCYGFDARKKMIMNFGPINKKGGEKRLNVIFSRAKKHMAVISSIQHFNITNEYNEGANYFRRFLQYAENVSMGNMTTARTILDGLVINKKDAFVNNDHSVVLRELKQQLEKMGYEVAEKVGQSDFKCSLAVKENPADEEYSLGILLDDELHYRNSNLVEQYYQRPAILQSFGWKCIHVFSKDWLEKPAKVMEYVVKKLKEPTVPGEIEPVEMESVPIETEPSILPGETTNEAMLIIEKEKEPKQSFAGFDNLVFERFIFTDAGSNKFWEAAVYELKLIVRFGRIDTKGQVQVKTFGDAEKAIAEKNKLVAEKLKKGYVKS